MKRKKADVGSAPEAQAEPILVLRKRTVASLSEDQLSDAAGGHPHPPTCGPTCDGDTCVATCEHTCRLTCQDTCPVTCDGGTCWHTCCGAECPPP